ncbi:(S)-ureidoglycine aminohydrolase [Alloacidobacterium dinghuense]|uniref:(S)-ureidoglycine aminohydrolase n=1 Tax=Alloacidobacterium dinghuense TaxID=2763107 RepID=A0A7G8BK00_9BACT|nr:(S)-ureidoglycine aminohydrolase [Alloacidobacterium dinghuense]QNI32870.1 (S)-ureidoglycine aminohydrolase [Alloacidobacterium dinghuense]
MHNLGHTRSVRRASHFIHTPDTFIRTQIPGCSKASVIVHASPVLGANFAQYSVEFEVGGALGSASGQRFFYVLDGTITLESGADTYTLVENDYAYVPQEAEHTIRALQASRATVIEQKYRSVNGEGPPTLLVGHEPSVPAQPLTGDNDLLVRSLLPDTITFDFAVNTMSYAPGAGLSMVEVHVMEHGLLMLEGGGIYRLDDQWYPVTAGDFIWMAPYCPQWFGAIGKVPAKYLIYKDWNRHPLA